MSGIAVSSRELPCGGADVVVVAAVAVPAACGPRDGEDRE